MSQDFALPAADSLEIGLHDTAAGLKQTPRPFALVDCREPEEWETCRIEGARLVPLSRFAEMAPVALDREQPVVVYCHHGMRSARATLWLRQQGYAAWSMAGGIDAWSRQIDPDVPVY